ISNSIRDWPLGATRASISCPSANASAIAAPSSQRMRSSTCQNDCGVGEISVLVMQYSYAAAAFADFLSELCNCVIVALAGTRSDSYLPDRVPEIERGTSAITVVAARPPSRETGQ